jgi:hypothetical protein
MRRSVVFLEQQSWVGGAQRVLEATLDSIGADYERIVAFPDRGPFRSALEKRDIETMELPIGDYRPGRKSSTEKILFAWRSLCCGLKLAAFIRRRRVSLVYINGPRCMPAGVLAAWLTRRPAIFHLHLFQHVPESPRRARRVAFRASACCQAAVLPSGCRSAACCKDRCCGNPCRRAGACHDPPQLPTDCITRNRGRITEGRHFHCAPSLLRRFGTRFRS